jgi:hypothetical protein
MKRIRLQKEDIVRHKDGYYRGLHNDRWEKDTEWKKINSYWH